MKEENGKKKPHLCGIYALIMDGVVYYVGQSVNIKKRFGQHLSLYQNKGFTPKQIWIRESIKAGKTITLQILEETKDLDAREIYWISFYQNLGQAKHNILPGGKEFFCSKVKRHEHLPWGKGWSPVQARLITMKRDIRFFKERGRLDLVERFTERLEKINQVIKRVGLKEMNLRLYEKYGQ